MGDFFSRSLADQLQTMRFLKSIVKLYSICFGHALCLLNNFVRLTGIGPLTGVGKPLAH